jgi:hypothetical protein
VLRDTCGPIQSGVFSGCLEMLLMQTMNVKLFPQHGIVEGPGSIVNLYLI